MDKTRPIQIVKTRGSQDLFKKEGSGGAEPKWVTPQAIRKNTAMISQTLQSLDRVFRQREKDGNGLPVLLVAALHEDATAKSHRPNVKSIFRTKQHSNIIGVAGLGELFVKIDTLDDLNIIKESISDIKHHRASKEKTIGAAAVQSLTVFHPRFNTNELAGKTVKIRLVDYKSDSFNQLAEQRFVEECGHHGIKVVKLNYAPDLFLFKVEEVNRDQLERIATMDSVISVKEMPYYEITAAPEPWNVDINVATPKQNESYPKIGILDSGVANLPQLSPWQIGNEHNAAGLEEFDIDRNHGTMVASVALYGDQLENEPLTGCGPSMFANCIINTSSHNTKISEEELVIFIRDSIKHHPDVRIWNISQGSSVEVSDDFFSEFAIALDEIQHTCNVLFCKSAGNTIRPGMRISQGAESVRCITVGSICQEGGDKTDLPKGTHSPFSRVGPGPEYLQKPDVVHYGGNSVTGINVVTAPGFTSREKGTSFATPRVTALAAHLAHRIGGQFNPTLIKALIVHNSQYPSVLTKNDKSINWEYGFGIPSHIDQMLYNNEDEFTMIWQPEISPTSGVDYQIIGFPYPSSLVDKDGNVYGVVTVTIVSNPILRGSEGNEYCQNDIEVSLEPIDSIEYVTVGAPGVSPIYRNETRVHPTKNILTPSAYSKKQKSIFLKERNLIITQNKYQPVKKYQVDLSTLMPAVKAKMKGKTEWVLRIKGFTRDATKDELTAHLNETGEVISVPVTIIVSIKDTLGKKVAYDEGIRLLDQNNFSHTNILVRDDIEIDAGNINEQ
ncbi:MAG: S8 family peptidase [Clostridium sp.]|nr:S8 family peptidase [Clostridium sp.]